MTVVEKVYLSTAVAQVSVGPKPGSFGYTAKGKQANIPAPMKTVSRVG